MTNGYDKCIAQMKLTNTVKLHFSHDNQCAHVIQPHKATVAMAHGTANLADIFIGKKYTSYNHTIGPAKVFRRRTSLHQFLNQVSHLVTYLITFCWWFSPPLSLSAAVTLRLYRIKLYQVTLCRDVFVHSLPSY